MSDKPRIQIHADINYLASESEPNEDRYIFAYTITIRNLSQEASRLLARHWVITDAHGKVQEVRGEGVVGETPRISPGEAFRYTSAAMIETPVGTMRGEYEMLADDGDRFEAAINPFVLAMPRVLH